MKSLMSLVLTVAFLAFAGDVLAEEKSYVPKDNEELYGTWVNKEYDAVQSGRPKHASWDWKSDGTWTSYLKSYHDKPVLYGKYSITEKWTDLSSR